MRLCKHCKVRVEQREWKHHGTVWMHVAAGLFSPTVYRDCKLPTTVAEPMGDD